MKYLPLLLALSFFACMASAEEWWGQTNEKDCDQKCYRYIKHCYDCLDVSACPPIFPAPAKKCDGGCYDILSFCKEKFPDCFDCNCPNLEKKEECPFEGATIKNEDCCKEEGSLGCSEFYCPGEGKEWECASKCDDDCLCPNTKRDETCPGEGIFLFNKYCCKKEDSDGCSAWKCPGAGEPWECADKC